MGWVIGFTCLTDTPQPVKLQWLHLSTLCSAYYATFLCPKLIMLLFYAQIMCQLCSWVMLFTGEPLMAYQMTISTMNTALSLMLHTVGGLLRLCCRTLNNSRARVQPQNSGTWHLCVQGSPKVHHFSLISCNHFLSQLPYEYLPFS